MDTIVSPIPVRPYPQFPGVACGIVVDVKDPDNLHRIRLRLPWLPSSERTASIGQEGDFTTFWAPVAMPMAGNGWGLSMLPAVGDQVVVAFEMGDITRPVVLGSIWSGADKPLHSAEDATRNVTLRTGGGCVFQASDSGGGFVAMQTGVDADSVGRSPTDRAGHRILISDCGGSETIEISDSEAGNVIRVDISGNAIEIVSKTGDIKVRAPAGKVSFECRDFELKAAASAEISSGSMLSLKSDGPASLESFAAVSIRGSVVGIN